MLPFTTAEQRDNVRLIPEEVLCLLSVTLLGLGVGVGHL